MCYEGVALDLFIAYFSFHEEVQYYQVMERAP